MISVTLHLLSFTLRELILSCRFLIFVVPDDTMIKINNPYSIIISINKLDGLPYLVLQQYHHLDGEAMQGQVGQECSNAL